MKHFAWRLVVDTGMADTDRRNESDTGTAHGFHVMAKPCGPACNLACTYCFYLEKTRLLAPAAHPRMSPEVLEGYVKSYIAGQPAGEVHFAWQGGEPLLLGTPFFEKAVELQKRFADGRTIRNSLQTNGTLLTDEWCGFLARNGFLVGVSIDGPRALHDAYRVDARGAGTFDKVAAGLELLRRHGVEWGGAEVCVVGRGITVGRPLGLILTRRSENSTVTLCHTGTRDLAAHTRAADIVVAAAGVPHMITADMIREGAVLVDVGVSRVDGKTVGDLAPDVWDKAAWVTPNPGGVGPMTRAMLLSNVVDRAEALHAG